MKKKIITFGEIMLRLAPEGYHRFIQADSFGATYGGGEANVAVLPTMVLMLDSSLSFRIMKLGRRPSTP